MGVKTGITNSHNWHKLLVKLPAYRRWNVEKDKRGTEETLTYLAYPVSKVRYKESTEILTDVGLGSRRGS